MSELDIDNFIKKASVVDEVRLFTHLEGMGYEFIDIGDSVNRISKCGESFTFKYNPRYISEWDMLVSWVRDTEIKLKEKADETLELNLKKKEQVEKYCESIGLDCDIILPHQHGWI